MTAKLITRDGNKKTSSRLALTVATLVVLTIVGCTSGETRETPAPINQPVEATPTTERAPNKTRTDVEMKHIHGLGFSPDGRQLIVYAHDGLRIYTEGKWLIPDTPAHDYIGFAPSDDGFYSSGHPNPSSGLVNPFGLIKSTDGGKTLIKLGFEGEGDFQLMAVGYQKHTIYVVKPTATASLSPGVYYSLDDGQTWQQSALHGVDGPLIQIAVHPLQAQVVALATAQGLFLSHDYGNSFMQVGKDKPVTAVTFDPRGETLIFGSKQLFSLDVMNAGYGSMSEQITPRRLPTLAADDGISYIALNLVRFENIALATSKRNIYLSPNEGKIWVQIVRDGKAH